MKTKKVLKKLDLSKEKISALTSAEAKNVQGGLFHSHVMCLQSHADAGCTASSRCAGGDQSTVTILCY